MSGSLESISTTKKYSWLLITNDIGMPIISLRVDMPSSQPIPLALQGLVSGLHSAAKKGGINLRMVSIGAPDMEEVNDNENATTLQNLIPSTHNRFPTDCIDQLQNTLIYNEFHLPGVKNTSVLVSMFSDGWRQHAALMRERYESVVISSSSINISRISGVHKNRSLSGSLDFDIKSGKHFRSNSSNNAFISARTPFGSITVDSTSSLHPYVALVSNSLLDELSVTSAALSSGSISYSILSLMRLCLGDVNLNSLAVNPNNRAIRMKLAAISKPIELILKDIHRIHAEMLVSLQRACGSHLGSAAENLLSHSETAAIFTDSEVSLWLKDMGVKSLYQLHGKTQNVDLKSDADSFKVTTVPPRARMLAETSSNSAHRMLSLLLGGLESPLKSNSPDFSSRKKFQPLPVTLAPSLLTNPAVFSVLRSFLGDVGARSGTPLCAIVVGGTIIAETAEFSKLCPDVRNSLSFWAGVSRHIDRSSPAPAAFTSGDAFEDYSQRLARCVTTLDVFLPSVSSNDTPVEYRAFAVGLAASFGAPYLPSAASTANLHNSSPSALYPSSMSTKLFSPVTSVSSDVERLLVAVGDPLAHTHLLLLSPIAGTTTITTSTVPSSAMDGELSGAMSGKSAPLLSPVRLVSSIRHSLSQSAGSKVSAELLSLLFIDPFAKTLRSQYSTVAETQPPKDTPSTVQKEEGATVDISTEIRDKEASSSSTSLLRASSSLSATGLASVTITLAPTSTPPLSTRDRKKSRGGIGAAPRRTSTLHKELVSEGITHSHTQASRAPLYGSHPPVPSPQSQPPLLQSQQSIPAAKDSPGGLAMRSRRQSRLFSPGVPITPSPGPKGRRTGVSALTPRLTALDLIVLALARAEDALLTAATPTQQRLMFGSASDFEQRSWIDAFLKASAAGQVFSVADLSNDLEKLLVQANRDSQASPSPHQASLNAQTSKSATFSKMESDSTKLKVLDAMERAVNQGDFDLLSQLNSALRSASLPSTGSPSQTPHERNMSSSIRFQTLCGSRIQGQVLLDQGSPYIQGQTNNRKHSVTSSLPALNYESSLENPKSSLNTPVSSAKAHPFSFPLGKDDEKKDSRTNLHPLIAYDHLFESPLSVFALPQEVLPLLGDARSLASELHVHVRADALSLALTAESQLRTLLMEPLNRAYLQKSQPERSTSGTEPVSLDNVIYPQIRNFRVGAVPSALFLCNFFSDSGSRVMLRRLGAATQGVLSRQEVVPRQARPNYLNATFASAAAPPARAMQPPTPHQSSFIGKGSESSAMSMEFTHERQHSGKIVVQGIGAVPVDPGVGGSDVRDDASNVQKAQMGGESGYVDLLRASSEKVSLPSLKRQNAANRAGDARGGDSGSVNASVSGGVFGFSSDSPTPGTPGFSTPLASNLNSSFSATFSGLQDDETEHPRYEDIIGSSVRCIKVATGGKLARKDGKRPLALTCWIVSTARIIGCDSMEDLHFDANPEHERLTVEKIIKGLDGPRFSEILSHKFLKVIVESVCIVDSLN